MDTKQREAITARVDEAQLLANMATPGEWLYEGSVVYSPGDKAMVCQLSRPHGNAHVRHEPVGITDSTEELRLARCSGRFIAASRTLLPALAADVTTLLDEVETLRGALEARHE